MQINASAQACINVGSAHIPEIPEPHVGVTVYTNCTKVSNMRKGDKRMRMRTFDQGHILYTRMYSMVNFAASPGNFTVHQLEGATRGLILLYKNEYMKYRVSVNILYDKSYFKT